ncbi:protein-L-isoaspartate(D-aspartate) O-methyltransferase [Pontivivens insulae]|uniref:Protein-L-isoaspartate O-methyltransferase n=1 Tax=Pontivivens insulae TaxID=1639689 RepID=A0A2R8A9P1_9RHOB|nr:protein-L-isoaspartate(D-aspartate) O-methyltransferase [Pontivivens insulae]RED12853.1 protein-L-isoaspartate(D-aspartate) O-methyltransferase [Pontivivens insulae]SPF28944.1 Protein-L-isoaspartate O-methyltransferase [Pontivivens insulae]
MSEAAIPQEEARWAFIFTLQQAGVREKAVLDALEATPRDRFVDGLFRARALEDIALPISCGQTISQPSVVGLMTQALEVTNRCKVLEIGAGSGYQAGVLSHLARRVYTIERHRPLARQARAALADLGASNVTVISGDGTAGLPEQAPFDRIIVTAAAEDVPAFLLDQLRDGGIMVIPVGQSDTVQQMIKVVKTPEGLEYTELGDVRFVPLLEGIAEDLPDG